MKISILGVDTYTGKALSENLYPFEIIKRTSNQKPDPDSDIVIYCGSEKDNTDLIKHLLINMKSLFILTSSYQVYGGKSPRTHSENSKTNPKDEYGLLRISEEDIVRTISHKTNLKYLILRISNIYGIKGNDDISNLIEKSFSLNTIEIENDINDFIYIEDLCEAIKFLIKESFHNKTLNIGSGYGVESIEIIKKIKKLTGKDVSVNVKPGIHHEILNCDKMHWLTGWIVKTSMEKGLMSILADY